MYSLIKGKIALYFSGLFFIIIFKIGNSKTFELKSALVGGNTALRSFSVISRKIIKLSFFFN